MKKALFFLAAAVLFSTGSLEALQLDKLKVLILNADYKAAIAEGERLMSTAAHEPGSDELYYLLGVSYLKNENYLRASDIFEIVLNEFKSSSFKDAAQLGLGDSYLLRGDLPKAEEHYRQLNEGKLKPIAYQRLSDCAAKSGNSQAALEYRNKLRSEFPDYPAQTQDSSVPLSGNFYYTVQAGSFLNSSNARNLAQKLEGKGYSAYVEEAALTDKTIYRVKVGRFSTRQEALDLENKLSREGYPTKVCP